MWWRTPRGMVSCCHCTAARHGMRTRAVAPLLVSLRLDRERSQWGSTDGPLVDTSAQFSWSAWVRPDLTAGTASEDLNLPVIAQEGSLNSFAYQRYNKDGAGCFVLPKNDKQVYSAAEPVGVISGGQRAALGAVPDTGGIRAAPAAVRCPSCGV